MRYMASHLTFKTSWTYQLFPSTNGGELLVRGGVYFQANKKSILPNREFTDEICISDILWRSMDLYKRGGKLRSNQRC